MSSLGVVSEKNSVLAIIAIIKYFSGGAQKHIRCSEATLEGLLTDICDYHIIIEK